MFEPDKIARFKDCGIHLMNSSDDIMSAALHYLKPRPEFQQSGRSDQGRRPSCQDQAVCAEVRFSEYLNALTTGEICFVVGFSGDIKQAQKRAAETKGGIRDRLRHPQGR